MMMMRALMIAHPVDFILCTFDERRSGKVQIVVEALRPLAFAHSLSYSLLCSHPCPSCHVDKITYCGVGV